MAKLLGHGDFVWWIGVVEDIDDPLLLGRVRVRINGMHTQDKAILPTNRLPWATVMQDVTSSAIREKGRSPTGLLCDSTCIGFFADGESGQQPIVMGTFAANPSFPASNDEHEVNRLARAEDAYPHPVLASKESTRTKSVTLANSGSTWEEPVSAYNAQYTHNHVDETDNGHIREVDDTPGAQRIHEYHASGTFYEVDNEGNRVTRIVANNYTVVLGSDFINVKGDCNLTVDANCRTHIKGNWDIQVDGNVNEVVKGNVTEEVSGRKDTTVTGEITRTSGTHIDDNAPRIDLN